MLIKYFVEFKNEIMILKYFLNTTYYKSSNGSIIHYILNY